MAVSANGTYGVGAGTSVTDAHGTVYAINDLNQVTINGKADPAMSRVDGLGYAYGRVWLKNADNHWFSKTSTAGQWVSYPAEYGVPMAPPIWHGDGSALYPIYPSLDAHLRLDGKGNTWTINAAGQVVVDGRVDGKTARVVQLEVLNGVIWKMTANGNWSSKTKPSDTWSPATTVDPRLAAQAAAATWVGGPGPGGMEGQNGAGGRAPAPPQTLTMHSGTMNLGSHDLAGDNLVINGVEPGARSLINMRAGGSLHLTVADSQPGGSVTVAVKDGLAALDVNSALAEPANIAITADKVSSVALHANISGGKLAETGGTVLLHGDSNFSNSTVLLDSDLIGSGTIVFQPTGGGNRLEVTGAVGAGVVVDMHGGMGLRQGPGVVVLDHAAHDGGRIMLQYAMLELKNLHDVDSASYRDSMLSLYHGGSIVASVRVSTAPTSGSRDDKTLHVSKDAAGTVYAATFASNQTPSTPLVALGTPLPIHA